jgi:hypothetical protein
MPTGSSNLGIPEWEGFSMRGIHRFIGTLVLAAAVVAPAAIVADAKAQEASVQVRIFDRDHRDYHNWDDREDRAYRRYLVEHRREYREYNSQKERDQRNYWKWRHHHPDHDRD